MRRWSEKTSTEKTGLDVRFVLFDDPRDDEMSAGADEADEMGIEFDQDLRRQVRHDQVEGFRECGDVPIGDLDAVFDLVDQDIFPCDLRRLSRRCPRRGPVSASSFAQAMPRMPVPVPTSRTCHFSKVRSSRRISSMASRHIRVEACWPVPKAMPGSISMTMSRPVGSKALPGRLDDDVPAHPEGLEVFLPRLAPVGIADDLRPKARLLQLRKDLRQAVDVGLKRSEALFQADVAGKEGLQRLPRGWPREKSFGDCGSRDS